MLTNLVIFVLCCIIVAQWAYIRYLSGTHFRVPGPQATRLHLRLWSLMRRPCAVLALDVRKLHTLNIVLGYSASTELVAQLVQIRRLPGRGRPDFVGQWGGDEFLIRVPPGAAWLVAQRIRGRADELTERMTPAQRLALREHTGGLVDGLCVAIAVVEWTNDAYDAARRAIDHTDVLKAGRVTGDRATSGAVGHVWGVVAEGSMKC